MANFSPFHHPNQTLKYYTFSPEGVDELFAALGRHSREEFASFGLCARGFRETQVSHYLLGAKRAISAGLMSVHGDDPLAFTPWKGTNETTRKSQTWFEVEVPNGKSQKPYRDQGGCLHALLSRIALDDLVACRANIECRTFEQLFKASKHLPRLPYSGDTMQSSLPALPKERQICLSGVHILPKQKQLSNLDYETRTRKRRRAALGSSAPAPAPAPTPASAPTPLTEPIDDDDVDDVDDDDVDDDKWTLRMAERHLRDQISSLEDEIATKDTAVAQRAIECIRLQNELESAKRRADAAQSALDRERLNRSFSTPPSTSSFAAIGTKLEFALRTALQTKSFEKQILRSTHPDTRAGMDCYAHNTWNDALWDAVQKIRNPTV